MFEPIPHETDPKMFVFVVAACGILSKGSGRSKREAKHDACANLMGKPMRIFDLVFFVFLLLSHLSEFQFVVHL